MDRKTLETQLAQFEADLENAKAVVYRTDGAIQLLKFQIDQLPPAAPVEPEAEGE